MRKEGQNTHIVINDAIVNSLRKNVIKVVQMGIKGCLGTDETWQLDVRAELQAYKVSSVVDRSGWGALKRSQKPRRWDQGHF